MCKQVDIKPTGHKSVTILIKISKICMSLQSKSKKSIQMFFTSVTKFMLREVCPNREHYGFKVKVTAGRFPSPKYRIGFDNAISCSIEQNILYLFKQFIHPQSPYKDSCNDGKT